MDFTNKESQLESIREIFAEATKEDGWDMSQEMLYSYYFVDKDVEKLKNFADKLEDDFDAIGIFEVLEDENGKETGEYLLHLDKVEALTPEMVAERNVYFSTLAAEHGIESYDGWEFGELEGDDDEDEEEEV